MTNENTVNDKTLERCSNDRIDREMSNIVDTVEDRIQMDFFIAIDSIVAPKIEEAFRSIKASSGRDAISVTANSKRGKHMGITAPFESASENNNVLHISNVNDETRNNIPDDVSELSVTHTRFDRKPHTHSSQGHQMKGIVSTFLTSSEIHLKPKKTSSKVFKEFMN